MIKHINGVANPIYGSMVLTGGAGVALNTGGGGSCGGGVSASCVGGGGGGGSAYSNGGVMNPGITSGWANTFTASAKLPSEWQHVTEPMIHREVAMMWAISGTGLIQLHRGVNDDDKLFYKYCLVSGSPSEVEVRFKDGKIGVRHLRTDFSFAVGAVDEWSEYEVVNPDANPIVDEIMRLANMTATDFHQKWQAEWAEFMKNRSAGAFTIDVDSIAWDGISNAISANITPPITLDNVVISTSVENLSGAISAKILGTDGSGIRTISGGAAPIGGWTVNV